MHLLNIMLNICLMPNIRVCIKCTRVRQVDTRRVVSTTVIQEYTCKIIDKKFIAHKTFLFNSRTSYTPRKEPVCNQRT